MSDQTTQAEGLANFFSSLGRAAKNIGKKSFKNPGRARELAANTGTAAASENPKLIAATAPDIIKFDHQGKSCTWVNFTKFDISFYTFQTLFFKNRVVNFYEN